jgi:gliding motility-associated-like protein
VIVKHVVYNSRGCKSDTAVFTITVADKPIVKFGFNAPVCNDSSLHFTDSSNVNTGIVNQWNWLNNNTTISTSQNPTAYFPFGDNQIGLSVLSNLGCFSDTVYKPFRLIRNPVVEMHFNDTCKYSPVRFTANETSTNIGINQWQWYFGNSQNGTGTPIFNTYTANGQYNITLYATSIEGCKDTVNGLINIYGTDADAGADVIAGVNQPIQLNATGGISYQWTPATGLNASNIPNPVSTHAVTGEYTYYLKAYTPGGCESYDTIVIKVYKGPDPYLPSIFTPNNDNVNDVLKPFLVGLTKFEYFAIYNRYGQQIFYSTSTNKGWDGKYQGKEQPIGSYIWVIKAVNWNSSGGVPTIYKGSVLLVR